MSGLSTGRRPDERTARRFDRAIALLAVVLGVVTAAVWLDPRVPTSLLDVPLEVAINVTATLVGGTVAVLAWFRWRETGRPSALFEASAFTALTVTNALITGLGLADQGAVIGLDPGASSPLPMYLWSMTRLVAAVLLLFGAIAGLRGRGVAHAAPLVAVGPAAALLLGAALFVVSGGARSGVASVLFDAAQLGAAIAFAAAAFGFRRLYRRDGHPSDAVLVAGLVVAAFSALHFAIDPRTALGVVTSGDLLRVGFHAILLYGVQAEIQAELVAVRRANVELARLRDIEAANATLAERARLAREIHDGLAQDLWFAKLKQGRVAGAGELLDDTRVAAREVLTALDSALAEARQSVMAMRADPNAGSTLEEVLRAYVDDFADRFGIRTEFDARSSLPRFPARTEAEILRIVQEALNNVRKHADATVVRVRAAGVDGGGRLTVSDNGRGFDVRSVPDDRFGLQGMRERAQGVGATITIESQPSDGTTIILDVPLDPRSDGAA